MTVIALSPTRVPLLHVDDERWEVFVAGRPVHVTRLEMLVLSALRDANGRVLTRTVLADRVGVYAGGSRTLDVHICRLRRKLGAAADLLVTIRGVGWKLLPS